MNVELVRTWKSRRRIQDICGTGARSLINLLASPLFPLAKCRTHLGVGYRSICQIANLAMEERGPAQLHRDVRDGVVVVRIVHSLQIVQVAEPQRLPVCRYAVGDASICKKKKKKFQLLVLPAVFPLNFSLRRTTRRIASFRQKFQRTSLLSTTVDEGKGSRHLSFCQRRRQPAQGEVERVC